MVQKYLLFIVEQCSPGSVRGKFIEYALRKTRKTQFGNLISMRGTPCEGFVSRTWNQIFFSGKSFVTHVVTLLIRRQWTSVYARDAVQLAGNAELVSQAPAPGLGLFDLLPCEGSGLRMGIWGLNARAFKCWDRCSKSYWKFRNRIWFWTNLGFLPPRRCLVSKSHFESQARWAGLDALGFFPIVIDEFSICK